MVQHIIPNEGTLLKMKIAAAFTNVGQVTDIDGPSTLIAAVETTSLESTLHTYRRSHIPNPDKMTFKLWFDPNDAAMHGLILSRVNTGGTMADDMFEIWFNDDHTTQGKIAFTGFFTKASISGVKTEENLVLDCELQLNSLAVITPGTP